MARDIFGIAGRSARWRNSFLEVMIGENTITNTANIYRAVPKDRKRWKSFEGQIIDIKTKVIHGSLDPVIIKEYVEGIEKFYSDVQVEYLDGGNFIVDEKLKQVAESIRQFIL